MLKLGIRPSTMLEIGMLVHPVLLPACPKPNSPPRNAKTSLPGAQHVVGPEPHCPLLPFGGDRRAANRARRACRHLGIPIERANSNCKTEIDTKQGFNHTPTLPACPKPRLSPRSWHFLLGHGDLRGFASYRPSSQRSRHVRVLREVAFFPSLPLVNFILQRRAGDLTLLRHSCGQLRFPVLDISGRQILTVLHYNV